MWGDGPLGCAALPRGPRERAGHLLERLPRSTHCAQPCPLTGALPLRLQTLSVPPRHSAALHSGACSGPRRPVCDAGGPLLGRGGGVRHLPARAAPPADSSPVCTPAPLPPPTLESPLHQTPGSLKSGDFLTRVGLHPLTHLPCSTRSVPGGWGVSEVRPALSHSAPASPHSHARHACTVTGSSQRRLGPVSTSSAGSQPLGPALQQTQRLLPGEGPAVAG